MPAISSSMPASAFAEVPMYADMTPATLQRLMSMLSENVLPTTPYFFHTATFAFLVILWAFTLGISGAMAFLFGKRYTGMNFDQRRTSDIYILNCVLTTTAAALQFASMGAFSLDFHTFQFKLLRVAATLIASNYVFEMIYRPRIRYPMIAHHLLTLFLIMLSLSVLYEVKDPSILLSGNCLMFLATLEQPTFIALLLYRLRSPERLVYWSLRISSVQTIIFKSVAAAGAIAVWIKWQRNDAPTTSKAYGILLWISIAGLYVTQWYGAVVTWKISLTLRKRYEKAAAAAGAGAGAGARPSRSAAELGSVQTLDKFASESKPSFRRASTGRSSVRLPSGLIPIRTSSVYCSSPSMPSTPLPIDEITTRRTGGSASSDRSTPEPACLYYATQQPNAPLQPDTECSSAASSVYEMPRSELTHGGRYSVSALQHGGHDGDDDDDAQIPRTETTLSVPAPAARRFPSQRRKPSQSSILPA